MCRVSRVTEGQRRLEHFKMTLMLKCLGVKVDLRGFHCRFRLFLRSMRYPSSTVRLFVFQYYLELLKA